MAIRIERDEGSNVLTAFCDEDLVIVGYAGNDTFKGMDGNEQLFGDEQNPMLNRTSAKQSFPATLPCLVLLAFTLGIAAPSVWAKEYYSSTSGNDNNPGTEAQPFRTITKGISKLQPGDILNLRHGVYVEAVDIAGKHGTATNNIVIRSYRGEHAYIDGSLPEFRKPNNTDWELASKHDPSAHPEEYVSVKQFPSPNCQDDQYNVNRGAFLDHNPYTRLITYSKLNDLRSQNETFEQIPITDSTDLREGPAVTDEEGKPLGYRFPWVYMGPGIWFNCPTGKVHIRLSHTHNNINGGGTIKECVNEKGGVAFRLES